MDYEVSFFQDSWDVENPINTQDLIQHVLDTRDAAIKELQLPGSQEGKADHVSAGIWLKVRTDRPKPASTTTAFVSLKDKGLHRPTPFSFFQKPLGDTQIRLLELLPGSIGHQLSGHLRIFDLDRTPSYSALSYTWGNPEAEDVIMIGDRVGRLQSIVGNLSLALKHLRRTDSSRMIWVDALCINQEDIDERSHQVQIMGTIFGSASEVLIWLGRKTADSEYVMMILQHLASGRGFEEHPPWETSTRTCPERSSRHP